MRFTQIAKLCFARVLQGFLQSIGRRASGAGKRKSRSSNDDSQLGWLCRAYRQGQIVRNPGSAHVRREQPAHGDSPATGGGAMTLHFPVLVGVITRKPLRFIRSQEPGPRMPWHMHDDLLACPVLPDDLKPLSRLKLVGAWKGDVWALPSTGGMLVTAY